MNRRVAVVVFSVVAVVFAIIGVGSASGQGAVEPITRTCEGFTDHTIHNGFQTADKSCVETEMGEVSSQDDNPQLIIVDAPRKIRANEPFNLQVSTRNLVRDRFLKAADGGYYLESGTLNEDGLTSGHVHTACRPIDREAGAPEPLRQSIFVATEDGGGGRSPDTFDVDLANGLPQQGTWQCASWGGDGSHRTPMMSFANQIPAFDAVEIEVKGAMKDDDRDKRDREEKSKDRD